MVEPLRHRQTKGAETDMLDLTPPRHVSTLPDAADLFVHLELPLGVDSTHCQNDAPTAQFAVHPARLQPIRSCVETVRKSQPQLRA
jgi:hypothetical protein